MKTVWLPPALAEEWDWQLQGACRGFGTHLFFHPPDERGQARDDRDRQAKAICRTCPVVVRCRQHALEAREPFGTWGGMTQTERAEFYRGS